MLRYLKIAKWRANKQLKQHGADLAPHKSKLIKRLQAIWFNLSTAQKLYLLALISLLGLHSGKLASLLTVIALIVEFWPKFIQLWHSLAGKALILVFYAIIANFVLASAGGIVNEVTQVSADHFNYTHNFAALLYLPPWALGITLTTLLLLQLILPVYIIALLLIKPFGSDRIKFITQSYSPLLTALMRFFLASVVFINLISFVDGRSTSQIMNDIKENFQHGQEIAGQLPEQQAQSAAQLSEAIRKPAEPTKPDNTNPSIDIKFQSGDKTAESLQHFLDSKGYFERSKWLIAMFAYNYEANSYSRCKKSENSKVVELNDYELVEIVADNNQPYGYTFTVRACESAGIKAP